MYLLSQLFKELPEVGDTDKPKLVFFFDEAHLLFKDASKDFLEQVAQTVRLIRSKGVGVFFVTQTPKDVPTDVLAQLGSRVQHQLRAHTPDAAKALKATVSTYPNSSYDLEEVLTQLAIGEAIVTVMNEKGAPSPVAWTRVRAPQGSMEPTPADQIKASGRRVAAAGQVRHRRQPASRPPRSIDAKEAGRRGRGREARGGPTAGRRRSRASPGDATGRVLDSHVDSRGSRRWRRPPAKPAARWPASSSRTSSAAAAEDSRQRTGHAVER